MIYNIFDIVSYCIAYYTLCIPYDEFKLLCGINIPFAEFEFLFGIDIPYAEYEFLCGFHLLNGSVLTGAK